MKKYNCDSGDLAYFILSPADHVEESDFDPIPGIENRGGFKEYLSHARSRELRLEVCSIDEKLALVRFVKTIDESNYIVYDIPKDTKVIGLEEAVFNSDYSKLNIEFPVGNVIRHGDKEESKDLLVIRGSKTKEALLIYSYFLRKDKPFLGSWTGDDIAQVGKLEFQEPLTADHNNLPADCKINPSDPERPYRADARFAHHLKRGVLTSGTFRIEWIGFPPAQVITASIDDTKGFWEESYMCKVKVTDTAADMGQQAGVPITFTIPFQGPELERSEPLVRYYQSHHFQTDGLWIKSPVAVYGFGSPNDNDPYLPEEGKNAKATYLKGNVRK